MYNCLVIIIFGDRQFSDPLQVSCSQSPISDPSQVSCYIRSDPARIRVAARQLNFSIINLNLSLVN
ncbi:MAG: hypothetical protein QNJ54_37705 [Prochloraceae cyanobacterium]|nr:hypothetical protein [Prochloraceae cyanobacterium]